MMKKTIHVNLAGMAFTIEEDAYLRLGAYLDAVETRLGGGDEAKETINDIESRIAELFSQVNRQPGTAIRLQDIEEVIRVIGNPDDILSGDDAGDQQARTSNPQPAAARRLYRDPGSRVLGGVCAGMGAYFNVDPLVFRLVFVVGLFYGISILPYIILWIVIPKAKTMEQLVQMYGGDGAFSKGKQTNRATRPEQPSLIGGFVRAVAIVAGILMIAVSFFSLVGLTIAVIFSGALVSFFPGGAWIGTFPGLLSDPSSSVLAIVGLVLVIKIPLLMLFYLGLHLIFQFRRGGKVIGVIALISWLVGIGLVIYSGVNMASQFSRSQTVALRQVLEPFKGDTLHVRAANIPDHPDGRRILRASGLQVWERDGNFVIEGKPNILVVDDATEFALTLEKSARGNTIDKATANASGLDFFWVQQDSVLMLDDIFTLQRGALFRNQKINVILEVPKDKHVKIDTSIHHLTGK